MSLSKKKPNFELEAVFCAVFMSKGYFVYLVIPSEGILIVHCSRNVSSFLSTLQSGLQLDPQTLQTFPVDRTLAFLIDKIKLLIDLLLYDLDVLPTLG